MMEHIHGHAVVHVLVCWCVGGQSNSWAKTRVRVRARARARTRAPLPYWAITKTKWSHVGKLIAAASASAAATGTFGLEIFVDISMRFVIVVVFYLFYNVCTYKSTIYAHTNIYAFCNAHYVTFNNKKKMKIVFFL